YPSAPTYPISLHDALPIYRLADHWRSHLMPSLPILPTTVVGSHGKPGWWFTLVKAYEAGEAGPGDLDEMFDDAVDAVVADMEERSEEHTSELQSRGHLVCR